jgi:hypothetical protein
MGGHHYLLVKQFSPVDIIWLLRDQFEKMPEIDELTLNSATCTISGEIDRCAFIIQLYDMGRGTTAVVVDSINPTLVDKICYALHL